MLLAEDPAREVERAQLKKERGKLVEALEWLEKLARDGTGF